MCLLSKYLKSLFVHPAIANHFFPTLHLELSVWALEQGLKIVFLNYSLGINAIFQTIHIWEMLLCHLAELLFSQWVTGVRSSRSQRSVRGDLPEISPPKFDIDSWIGRFNLIKIHLNNLDLSFVVLGHKIEYMTVLSCFLRSPHTLFTRFTNYIYWCDYPRINLSRLSIVKPCLLLMSTAST